MGLGLSAIYSVVHSGGWRVDDFLIKNATFDRAKKGYVYPRSQICIEFRRQLAEELGRDPGFIFYDELEFTKRHDISVPDELPPMLKPASHLVKEIQSLLSSSRR